MSAIFADEDLKTLKDALPTMLVPAIKGMKFDWPTSLLARLEAAERALEFMQVHPGSFKPAWDAVQAWRKASGRDE